MFEGHIITCVNYVLSVLPAWVAACTVYVGFRIAIKR